MKSTVLVSVVMITYNHEKFIREAIEGVLMQQCEFGVELIIADDNSPDNTEVLVQKIVNTHPRGHWIKYTRHTHNKGMHANFLWAINQCAGEYIALCEGDDYWTNPEKLQKQMGFLEANVDFGLVHADCDFKYIYKNKVIKNYNRYAKLNLIQHDHADQLFISIINNLYKIRTATVMFRKDILYRITKDLEELSQRFSMGDTPMWLYMSRLTKFHYMDESVSIYRMTKNSVSRPNDKAKRLKFVLSSYEMRIFFLRKFGKEISFSIANKYNESLINYKLYDPNYKEMFSLHNPSVKQKILLSFSRFKLFRLFFRLRTKPNYFRILGGRLSQSVIKFVK